MSMAIMESSGDQYHLGHTLFSISATPGHTHIPLGSLNFLCFWNLVRDGIKEI